MSTQDNIKESGFFLWKLLRILEAFFCIVPVAAMTIIIFASVIFRYVLLSPLGWAEEFTKVCMLWCVFGAASYCFFHGLNVGVTFLVDRFDSKARHIIQILIILGTMLFMAILLFTGYENTIAVLGKYTNAARIPMWIPYSAIPVGCLMSILRLSEQLIAEFRIVLRKES